MRTKKITEIISCEARSQVKQKIEEAEQNSTFDLVEVNIKAKPIKDGGEVVGTEYVVKLVKAYD